MGPIDKDYLYLLVLIECVLHEDRVKTRNFVLDKKQDDR
jgi:hypothetical protein